MIGSQVHAKFHVFATLCVLIASLGFGVSRLEALALALSIGCVWTAEGMNTAFELLVDLLHPSWDRRAGRVKDMAAGAVLLATIAAVIVGLLVFIPKIWPGLVE